MKTRMRILALFVMLFTAIMCGAENLADLLLKRDALWEQAKTVIQTGDKDSALVLTRKLISLMDEKRWDTVPFEAHKFRAQMWMSDSVKYEFRIYSEYDYFSHYPQNGPLAREAESLADQLLEEYYNLRALKLQSELPIGLYVSEIHESDKELKSQKLVIGEKRHKDIPFFSFFISEKDDGSLVAKISAVCGVSRDMKAVDVYSGKYNEFVLETPLMKNDNGGYFFEISTQSVKNAHTSTANTLSQTGAEFNQAARNAIETAPAGKTGEKLAASAVAGVISGLFEFGASLARKGHVANQMITVELYPKGQGRIETVFRRVDFIVDQSNNETSRVMNKVFDSFLLQAHHEPWFCEPDNFFFASYNGVFHPADKENMDNNSFYSSIPYIGSYDKKGKWKRADITKLGRRSMAHLLASEYLSFLDDDEPALKHVPDFDTLLSFTVERSHDEDSWKRALYDTYLGDYDPKTKKFKSFYIKRTFKNVVVHYSNDKWKTHFVSVYNLFHNTLVRCRLDEFLTIQDYKVVRDRTDGFSIDLDDIKEIL